ncbi:ABC transporter ATP-binding protein [Cohnella xylanilytica]|uniref:ABC transporter ATP-binding protein n=1 Tax=Cohnella xylanilytica TaxID=557555 RepID=A0A841U2I4_9BACL|nr:ABC transporter ATP-binding protein [Cohnella xylanilytica]MBB6693989.1 ABC transporter ATP-binding protein [Cohnella xylanilytica]
MPDTSAAAPRALVVLSGACKRYDKRNVLENVNLAVREGELTAIVGSNGSGKSTLLRLLAGIAALSSGERRLAESPEPIRIGYAPDRLPKLRFSAREYLRYMAAIAGLPEEKAEIAIDRYLTRLGLAHTGPLQMRHFSKGMLQKANLIQAVLAEPRLLLLDEPFSGLDESTREEMTGLLRELAAGGTTIVVASHDREWVDRLADRCVAIENGRIGSDETYPRARRRVREVTARMPGIREADAAPRSEGVVDCRTEGDVVRYRVEAERSDALLKELLEAGASILEVTEERTEAKP